MLRTIDGKQYVVNEDGKIVVYAVSGGMNFGLYKQTGVYLQAPEQGNQQAFNSFGYKLYGDSQQATGDFDIEVNGVDYSGHYENGYFSVDPDVTATYPED